MTRSLACLLVCLLWAGIYLPGLGATDLKGEEPRRALPAIHMLNSGDWLVPRVGAEPYLRKPPLLNWLIALSFKFGGIHEGAARLPSALAVLALGLVIVVNAASWLSVGGAFLAALFWMTNIAVMETGRLAELEAVYCALTGIAFVLWMTAWLAGASPWRLWLPPAVFLALGMLEKGPAHLLCFYAVAAGTVARARSWKVLGHPAHLVAVVIILGSFAAWAVPCARAVAVVSSQNAWTVWVHQVTSHSANPDFHFRDWIQNGPRGLAALLPWTVFLPLLCRRQLAGHFEDANPRERALIDGARFGALAVFIFMSLLPAASPRYVYPLICVPCLLLGRVLTAPRSDSLVPPWLPKAWRGTNLTLLVAATLGMLVFAALAPGRTAAVLIALSIGAGATTAAYLAASRNADVVQSGAVSGAIMVFITGIYAVAVIPRMIAAQGHSARRVAAEIRRSVPAGAVVWVQESRYHPFWYYLEPRVAYFSDANRLPVSARYLLLPGAGPAKDIGEPGTAKAPPEVLLRRVADGHSSCRLVARQLMTDK